MKLTDSYRRTLPNGSGACRLKAPFDTVLFLSDVVVSDQLSPQDKVILCTRLLFGRRMWSMDKRQKMLQAAFDQLHGKQRQQDNQQPVIDFEQDAELIRAAFKQQYGVDLNQQRGRMSWWQFQQMLSSITDATVLGQVMRIRSTKIPAATPENRKQREQLIRAKSRVAIRNRARGKQRMNSMWDEIAEMLIKQAKG